MMKETHGAITTSPDSNGLAFPDPSQQPSNNYQTNEQNKFDYIRDDNFNSIIPLQELNGGRVS